jgi:hypothetical protein
LKETIKKYCSYCYTESEHIRLELKVGILKKYYRCNNCENITVKCTFNKCNAMARGILENLQHADSDKWIQKLSNYTKAHWNNWLCDEHNGRIATFENLDIKLESFEDYKIIFKRKRPNVKKIGSNIIFIGGGIVIAGPLSSKIVPEIASWLGAAGRLGTTKTSNVLIKKLAGGALKNASVAALGTTNRMIITATGRALGGQLGGAISNNFHGEVKDFKFHKIQEGGDKSVIFINGWLSQKKDSWEDWKHESGHLFHNFNLYGLTWESKNLYKIGRAFGLNIAGGTVSLGAINRWVRRATKAGAKNLTIGGTIINLAKTFKNPWHSAMIKAQLTGAMLADAIARMPDDHSIILAGHSLGARVIFYALLALSTRKTKKVKNVILAGGAVSKTDITGWENALEAVSGKIYNFYTDKDKILKYAYKTANAFQSEPIGLGPINSTDDNIININCSKIIHKHSEWKTSINSMLPEQIF